MNDPSNWRASKAQRQEITELLGKLGWRLEDYGGGLTWENLLWLQAISIINGATWCLENPKAWYKK